MRLISIIIPAYNVEEWILECLQSAASQTYTNIEVIIVNDGSKDSTGKICSDFCNKDSRFKLYTKENGGLSSARNYGINVARGEYLYFLDGDDYLPYKAIESLYPVDGEEYDIAIGIMERENNALQYYGDEVLNRTTCLENMLLQKKGITHSASGKLFKKELFNNITFPVGKLYEDEFTIFDVVSKAKIIKYIGKCVYYYRYRSGSILTSKKNLMKKCDDLFEASSRLSTLTNIDIKLEKPIKYRQTRDNIGIIDMIRASGIKDDGVYQVISRSKKSLRMNFWSMMIYPKMSLRSKAHLIYSLL